MQNPETHSTTTQFLAARDAARFFGVSVNHFRVSIGPQIPSSDFARKGSRKRLPRWSVEALLDWAATQEAR
jgi:hypothetical protein